MLVKVVAIVIGIEVLKKIFIGYSGDAQILPMRKSSD